MCTVSININEALLRTVMPELDTLPAIQDWVQQQIDLRIRQIDVEATETISIEGAREMALNAVREDRLHHQW
jgi:hypothetical protein